MTYILFNLILSLLCIINLNSAQEIQYTLSSSAVLDADHNCNVSLAILPSKGLVYINMTGPDSLWFSVGFGGSTMKDTYSIVCFKEYKNHSVIPICRENKLSATGYGKSLSPTITVLSDAVTKNVRSVSMMRNITLEGSMGSESSDYFAFPTTSTVIDTIHAIGKNDTFTASTPHMGPGGPYNLEVTDSMSNNLTTAPTPLGSSIVLNSLVVYPDQDLVQINMTGPEAVYFGVGFNSTQMGSTYSITCDTKGCHENMLGTIDYGTELQSTLNVISSTTSNGKRTVVINRKRTISTSGDLNQKYFAFPRESSKFPVIYAIGIGSTWSKDNGMSFNATTFGSKVITMTPSGSTTSSTLIATKVLFSKMDHTIEVSVEPSKNTVNISMTGPSDKWFGIGFNTTSMDGAYCIICSPDHNTSNGSCFEHLLSANGVGQTFKQQLIITVSDTITSGVRTVELQRKQVIDDNSTNSINSSLFYNFPSSPSVVPVIYSYGTNGIFVQNQSHMAGYGVGALTFSNTTGRANLSATISLSEVDQGVTVHVLPDTDSVKIMMNGPDDKWFGIVFGVESLDEINRSYAIIADTNSSTTGTSTTVKEYIIDITELNQNGMEYQNHRGITGKVMSTNHLKVNKDETGGNQRRVTVERAVSEIKESKESVTENPFNFPVSPHNVSIIGLKGNMLSFNATNSMLMNSTVSKLVFTPFTPSGGGGNQSNGSMCNGHRVSYGTEGAIGNGLTIGLTIYCQTKTIQMSMEYTKYDQNWIGFVWNDMMLSPYASIFTTGKPDETQRDVGLYSYALNNYDSGDVVYHPEQDWKAVSQKEENGTVSLVYEVPLSQTKWSTSTQVS